MDKKYDYIVYGNDTEWCEVVNYDLKNLSNAIFVNDHVQLIKSNFLRMLCKIHFSERMNRFFQLPLKNIWYRFFHKFTGIIQDDSVFLFYDWNKLSYDDGYHRYLKSKYKNCKLVFIFTNIVNKSCAYKNGYFNKLKSEFDLVITYDHQDAIKHSLFLHSYMYSKILDDDSNNKIDLDVFFIGHAKERLGLIHSIYRKLTDQGFKCLFYITGVEDHNKLDEKRIIYNKTIPYREALNIMIKSKCILEVMQEGASTFTLRTQEAILYNKKLITNNKNIRKESFYDEKNILIIDKDIEHLDFSFLNSDIMPNYNNELTELFSPVKLYERIKTAFAKKQL